MLNILKLLKMFALNSVTTLFVLQYLSRLRYTLYASDMYAQCMPLRTLRG